MKIIIDISKPLLKELIEYSLQSVDTADLDIEQTIFFILHSHLTKYFAKYKDSKQ